MSTERTEKGYDVKIRESKEVWNEGETRLVKTKQHTRYNDESNGVSPLIAVIKAVELCRKSIVDLDMVTVEVDGCPFPG